MDSRIASLESDVGHLKTYTAEIRQWVLYGGIGSVVLLFGALIASHQMLRSEIHESTTLLRNEIRESTTMVRSDIDKKIESVTNRLDSIDSRLRSVELTTGKIEVEISKQQGK